MCSFYVGTIIIYFKRNTLQKKELTVPTRKSKESSISYRFVFYLNCPCSKCEKKTKILDTHKRKKRDEKTQNIYRGRVKEIYVRTQNNPYSARWKKGLKTIGASIMVESHNKKRDASREKG